MNSQPPTSEILQQLLEKTQDTGLYWTHRPNRYYSGDVIDARVTGICPRHRTRVRLNIEQFVGGGFAGQVYRVRIEEIDLEDGPIQGLHVGGVYAVKIGKPPSRGSLWFRNCLYRIAYQGAFAPQLFSAAARSGVLWQKLIRRGTGIVFGTEKAAVDTYGTFYDEAMTSWAEINEWIEGRNWKFEIDDRLFERKMQMGDASEYAQKKMFMRRFVDLCHDMGAHEFARQYEWWTAKSQPNVLKRVDSDTASMDGLTAIDFRAGLVLLPLLPMSPADFKLILQGVGRGNLVQFDRGDVHRLENFIHRHETAFEDLLPALDELKDVEQTYRAMLPDLTHHGYRILTDPALGRSIVSSTLQAWQQRDRIDRKTLQRLLRSPLRFLFAVLLDGIPLVGKRLLRLMGNHRYATHVAHCFSDRKYLTRFLRARQASILLEWHRNERAGDERVIRLIHHPFRFWIQQILLGWLPSKWHRFLAEPTFAWDRMKHVVTYPMKLYFDAAFREEWLLNMVEEGRQEGMLTTEEENQIKDRIKDPYIQIYLKALAVHVCTLPLTQVISLIIAIFAMLRYGETWAESMAYAAAVLAFFQVTPISPGSLARGSYVIYLMFRDRSVKNYWIAAMVSFWHYIGYLGFPLQMVTKYPLLARFMAGRWATNLVHIIPVFGERGALLEYGVFHLFFNIPLSIRRLFKRNSRRKIIIGPTND